MSVLFFTIIYAVDAYSNHPDSVLLSEVKTLTFQKGLMTRGKRASAIRQMSCVGGDACQYFEPVVINCRNIGQNDRREVQWECQAQMEEYYRLGKTQVSCEGYRDSNDPFVLSGSCGVEYTLHLTEKGKQRHLSRFDTKERTGPMGPMGLKGDRGPPGKDDIIFKTEDVITICIGTIVCTIIFLSFCACICGCCGRNDAVYIEPRRRAAYSPGFWGGYFIGSSGRSSTTVINNTPPSSSSGYSSSYSSPSTSSKTYTSTGWGGTKKR